ncbi:hypothetical protein C6501_06960 [Candidatus Poribacteria bacterium]|nr:MAG: hypothetical protein C6501_06960 [Candidatus Poribacteria bacterium]
MNTKFFVMLIIGIFVVGATMMVYNSEAVREKPGRMWAGASCYDGANPTSNTNAYAAGELLVTMYNQEAHQEDDYAEGSGTIKLKCGNQANKPKDQSVSVLVIAESKFNWIHWIWEIKLNHKKAEQKLECQGPTTVSSNVEGTADMQHNTGKKPDPHSDSNSCS